MILGDAESSWGDPGVIRMGLSYELCAGGCVVCAGGYVVVAPRILVSSPQPFSILALGIRAGA